MSVYLYIMGLIPSLIVTYHKPSPVVLKPWARFSIVVFWPISFTFVALIFLWALWKEGR